MLVSGDLKVYIVYVAFFTISMRSPLASHEVARAQTLFGDYLGPYQ